MLNSQSGITLCLSYFTIVDYRIIDVVIDFFQRMLAENQTNVIGENSTVKYIFSTCKILIKRS